MPVVGAVDISIGVLTLIQPVRAVILYMAFWGFHTACLRPLAGQGMWELLERAGNYGAPLAFLSLLGAGRSLADWFSTRPAPTLTLERASATGWILRVTTALLLIGHGGFDLAMHKDWTGYAAAVASAPPPSRPIRSHPWRDGSSVFWVCSSSPARRAASCSSSSRGSSAPKPSGRWRESRCGRSSSAAAVTGPLSRSRGFRTGVGRSRRTGLSDYRAASSATSPRPSTTNRTRSPGAGNFVVMLLPVITIMPGSSRRPRLLRRFASHATASKG